VLVESIYSSFDLPDKVDQQQNSSKHYSWNGPKQKTIKHTVQKSKGIESMKTNYVLDNFESEGKSHQFESSVVSFGRRPRRLNREGVVMDMVLRSERIEAPLLATFGLVPASNSRRNRRRPPCRSSTKTSADETPCGLIWRQICCAI